MRWGPGRSWIAWVKTMRTRTGCDCACDGDDEGELVNTLRNGQGAPAADLGIDGDFYIDTDSDRMYGPKGGIGGSLPGEWVFAGSPISLVGPEGPNPNVTGRQILFGEDPSTPIGGAAHATVSNDGYIETRTAALESVATTGHWRTGYNVGTILGSLDSGGTSRNLLGLFQSTAGGPVLGSTQLGVMSVVGDGMVLNARTAEVIMNAAVYDVLVGTPSLVLRHEINSTAILNGHPRHGLSTAWGASEGEVDISSTGTYSLTSAQYKYAIWRLTGAATGTYTVPAPTNIQSYVRYVEETGGYDKVITKGSGTTYTLKANTSRLIKVTANGVYEIGAASSSVNYRKDVVGAGASLGYVDLTVNGKDATTLNINVSSGSGDCDGFAHDLVDPETMVLTVIITLNGGGAEGGGSGTFTFNALAGATAAYMIRDFDGSSNDIVIGLNSVIQFVWDGNGWRLVSSVPL